MPVEYQYWTCQPAAHLNLKPQEEWHIIPAEQSAHIEQARLDGKTSVNFALALARPGQFICNEIVRVLLEVSLLCIGQICWPLVRSDGVHSTFHPLPDFDEVQTDSLSWLCCRVTAAAELGEWASCPICLECFTLENLPLRLSKCANHYFHSHCIRAWLAQKPQCPWCKTLYGVITGNCPRGQMYISWSTRRLPGYKGGLSRGTWSLKWHMQGGIQTASHPNPGVPYEGSIRRAYLPDTDSFRKVLKLLQIAWQRRLMFTIGTSLTTGQCNKITFSSIHIRSTDKANHPFGWPCPTYHDSVVEELARLGVAEDQIESLLKL